MALELNTRFDPSYGRPVELAPGVLRLTAENPSPFTFHGTNTYIIGGKGALAVIDPGPDDEKHLQSLLETIDRRPVSHILISHKHRDHSTLAHRLSAITGASTLAYDIHVVGRVEHGEAAVLDAGVDAHFRPDAPLADNAVLRGDDWTIRVLHTPGHAADHCAFALEGTGITFSADHVMAWSTTVVAPPDGSMADYMASLDRLMEREDRLLLPGHGGAVEKPRSFMRALKAHRKMRERAIMERLAAGDRKVHEIVRAIYRDTDPRLHGAAALSVLAHLEDLVIRGRVDADGPPSMDAAFRPA